MLRKEKIVIEPAIFSFAKQQVAPPPPSSFPSFLLRAKNVP